MQSITKSLRLNVPKAIFPMLSASPLLAGALYAASSLTFGYWWLSFVCLLPLIYRMTKIGDISETNSIFKVRNIGGSKYLFRYQLKQYFISGFSFGGFAFLVGAYWLLSIDPHLLGGDERWLVPIWFLMSLVYGIHWGLCILIVGILMSFVKKRISQFSHFFKIILIFSVPVLAMEWQQVNLFPVYIGYGLIEQETLLPISQIAGVYGFTLIVVIANLTIFKIIDCLPVEKRSVEKTDIEKKLVNKGSAKQKIERDNLVTNKSFIPIPKLTILIVSIISLFVFLHEPNQKIEKSGKYLNIALVQSNIGSSEKQQFGFRDLKAYQALTTELLDVKPKHNASELDLIVWPETVHPSAFYGELPIYNPMLLGLEAPPIIFGGTRGFQTDGVTKKANTVWFQDQNQIITQSYTKRKLIPIVEEQSSKLDFLLGSHRGLGNYQVLDSENSIQFQEGSIFTPICFELLYPNYVQETLDKTQANLVVTLANDSWFRDKTVASIHFAIAKLRAVELDRWVVRATNTGISGFISPQGLSSGVIENNVQGTSIGTVQYQSTRTLYSKYGAWLPALLSIILLVLVLIEIHLKIRESKQFRKHSTVKSYYLK